jgi:hypothetical protein
MAKPLILLDVDETIVDTQYRLTVDPDVFRAAIVRVQERGAVLGLNSDSAFETLDRRARNLALRGPIVAERGALVATDRGIAYTNQKALWLPELRDRFVRAFTEGGRADRFAVLLGDVNQLADALPGLPEAAAPRTLILVNGFRRCSLAFYVRRWRKDGLHRDVVYAGEVFRLLEDIGEALALTSDVMSRHWFDRDVDVNPAYGICIIHDRQTTKSCAIDHILAEAGDRPVHMIGNSMSDDLKDSRVIQCAVGNADADYQARCRESGGLIAEQSLTAGVIELLDRITRA